MPIYELEIRASDHRRRLQASVTELKSKVRESLDMNRAARLHFGWWAELWRH
jgi:hypothetical protein